MSRPGLQHSLSEEEFDRLADFLGKSTSERAMNIEMLDGFFCALLVGPETVPPSEYLPVVFGDTTGESWAFDSMEEANEILALLMRHWNAIASVLQNGKPHLPVLLADAEGVERGNDWAEGFMRGIGCRGRSWAELIQDEEHGGCLIPMMLLAFEHDEDPKLRAGPFTSEKRTEILAHMAAGVVLAYRYFLPRRQRTANASPTQRHSVHIGRNDPCPCGSGKKYKRCCCN